ncbi:hypothetical protein OS493_032214 [Desmophyllum pertusum]|uniref:Uncharacterized protein n=1 Tax=Desmophyllum pertusum TaxID=174260 RepID=A0A9W9ZX50_9CNID|nr:hypothetical protein OS493_032214 [Desmophyllum pertusum]
MVGRYVIDHTRTSRKRSKFCMTWYRETWKNFKIQKCIKGGTCISKAFIDQAKAIKDKADVLKDKFKKQVKEFTNFPKAKLSLVSHGVSSNKGKASLLVVTNFANGVKRSFNLEVKESVFSENRRCRRWLEITSGSSDSSSNKIHHQSGKSGVTGTFRHQNHLGWECQNPFPSKVQQRPVSYDEPSNVFMGTDGKGGKAYGYKAVSQWRSNFFWLNTRQE